MSNDILFFGPDDDAYEIIEGYETSPSKFLGKLSEIATPLQKNAQTIFGHIEKCSYTAPSFIEAVKSAVPESSFQAVLSSEQKRALADGSLKLMTKKDGSLLATLINPKTSKIVSTIPLETVKLTPELTHSVMNYSTQMQIAKIAEQVQTIQLAIGDVRKGQENDRLALAYSCQQKLFQAREVENQDIKTSILLQVISDAEDSRNLLMLSQKSNVEFIQEEPETTVGKFFKGAKTTDIETRMSELREGLMAINMVSLSETMAYIELGEPNAAKKCLNYFGDFLKETYLSNPKLLERLDMIDPAVENYWSDRVPVLEDTILNLPINIGNEVLEIDGN